MALTANVELLNTLPDLVLCGNKIPLQLQASTNLIENAGLKAEIRLQWDAVAVADEYFDLLLNGETVRFTCKAAPDNSGIQFHDNTLNATLANWVALLATDLKKNYLIAKYYDLVVLSSVIIKITAKTEGVEYSQEFTAGAGIDVTPTETNKTGIDKTLRAFYGITVLLYCNNAFVTELFLNVDSAGLAEVDIADILKPYLTQSFKWPESASEFIFDRNDAIASWYFYYGERWGDADYKALTLSSTYYVMDGGVSWMQQAKLNADVSSFWAKLLLNKYFLSWAPLTRYITPTEPLKLYFINHSAAAVLTPRARLYKKAGVVNLISSLVNTIAPYETFETEGTEVLSAIETELLGRATSGNTFSITVGERIYVSVFLTLNSGEAPTVQLILDGQGTRSNAVQLSEGQNDFYLTTTGQTATAKLLLINSGNATNFSTSPIIIYRDPTVTVENNLIFYVNDKALSEIVFSPAKVGYEGLNDETLEKIEVYIENENGVIISETRTFIIDYSHYEHTRYFIFRNSLGAYEVLRTTGLITKSDDYARDVANIDIDSDFTSLDREDISVGNSEQQKFSLAIGWLNRYAEPEEFRNWLRDFALSKEVYQVIGDTIKPIRLINSTFSRGKDRDTLAEFTFQFVNAFSDEFFTKEITANLINESFADDFERAQ
jgi:hypothetical protein